jgi:hypothetical protein
MGCIKRQPNRKSLNEMATQEKEELKTPIKRNYIKKWQG